MFEADRGTGLSHPNIVQTYKSNSSISKVGASPATYSRKPSAAGCSGPATRRHEAPPQLCLVLGGAQPQKVHAILLAHTCHLHLPAVPLICTENKMKLA